MKIQYFVRSGFVHVSDTKLSSLNCRESNKGSIPPWLINKALYG